ncbi:MAG: M23 family metallopeptidase, partial [Acidiferrobacterales bacterium]
YAGLDGGYGKMVQINDGDGLSTRYGHTSKILVRVGEWIKKGQEIALVGSTGYSTGPHVHFEVLEHGHEVNPLPYLRSSSSPS